jgi:hypothetical protein
MALGPVDYVVLAFPGNQFHGEIAPALQEVVDKGFIRIIDLIFATKAADGSVTVREFADSDPDIMRVLSPVVGDIRGMLTQEDMKALADLIDPNSSGAILVFEHIWARNLREAIANADGILLDGGTPLRLRAG